MKELLIIIGISVFVALSSLLSADKFFDNRRKGFRKIQIKGWIMVCLNLGIITFSIFQYVINKNEIQTKEIEAEKNQNQRDSIQNANLDANNFKTIATISGILGKYGYMLDAANQKLIKIVRDSSKTKVLIQDDPVLQLCPESGIKYIKHADKLFQYEVYLCSFDASSAGYELVCPITLEDSLANLRLYGLITVPDDIKIAKDKYLTFFISVPDTIRYKFLYVSLVGTYMNLDKSKRYNINEIYYFNRLGKTFGLIKGETKKRIISFLKTKEQK